MYPKWGLDAPGTWWGEAYRVLGAPPPSPFLLHSGEPQPFLSNLTWAGAQEVPQSEGSLLSFLLTFKRARDPTGHAFISQIVIGFLPADARRANQEGPALIELTGAKRQ